MLTTITAALLLGASTGLLFNVRMVFHLTIAALLGFGLAALIGLTSPANAGLYTVAAVVALQVGYFVSLVIGALGLTREPVPTSEEPAKTAGPIFWVRSKRPRA